jgi:hypothetical protein
MQVVVAVEVMAAALAVRVVRALEQQVRLEILKVVLLLQILVAVQVEHETRQVTAQRQELAVLVS